MRRMLTGLAATVTLVALPLAATFAQDYSVPAGTPAHIKSAVELDTRLTADTERDPARLPAEILTLAALQQGDKIAEITALNQYYTIMLAEAVGPEGRIDMYDMPYMEDFGAGDKGRAFEASHPNTTYTNINYNDIEFADDLDAVYIVLYYHDFGPQEIDTAAFNRKVFNALDSGGKYLIVDHQAEAGSGWRDAGTIHRIDTQVIIDEITAAGFELLINSDLLANPEDDRTAMVFSPGTRGATDRSVFVFEKPE